MNELSMRGGNNILLSDKTKFVNNTSSARLRKCGQLLLRRATQTIAIRTLNNASSTYTDDRIHISPTTVQMYTYRKKWKRYVPELTQKQRTT